jgi:hypothetical protein
VLCILFRVAFGIAKCTSIFTQGSPAAGTPSEALEIFRSLLRTNPNDNIGARYCILAIRMGLGPDYEGRFLVEPGFIDAEEISRWFEKHSRKFPDEFGWWWKEIEKIYGKIG